MKISLKLLESNKEIGMMIGKALLPQVDKQMNSWSQKLKITLPTILQRAITNSPEYASILGGQLRYELGIPNAPQALSTIITIWTTNVNVEYGPPTITQNGQIKSSISVSMVKSDYSDVLGSSAAYVYDYERKYTLPWLRWLLLEGAVPIVSNHYVVVGANKSSRTGMAIMKEGGGSWSVPSRYAGTITDNWITRAIFGAGSEIENLMQKVLAK